MAWRDLTIESEDDADGLVIRLKECLSQVAAIEEGDNKYKVRIKVMPFGKKLKRSFKSIRIDKVDVMAREYIQGRDRACRMQLDGFGMCAGRLVTAHIFSRSRHKIRYDPENLLRMCHYHHDCFDSGKGKLLDIGSEMIKWLISEIGQKVYERLLVDSLINQKKAEAQFIWEAFYREEEK